MAGKQYIPQTTRLMMRILLTHRKRKQILPKMKYSDEFICKNTFVKSGKTKPPARYTEATLLSAMENPSRFVNDKNMKEYLGGGLGTPATRADIIEKLCSSFYVEKQGNSMVPTSKRRSAYRFGAAGFKRTPAHR